MDHCGDTSFNITTAMLKLTRILGETLCVVVQLNVNMRIYITSGIVHMSKDGRVAHGSVGYSIRSSKCSLYDLEVWFQTQMDQTQGL